MPNHLPFCRDVSTTFIHSNKFKKIKFSQVFYGISQEYWPIWIAVSIFFELYGNLIFCHIKQGRNCRVDRYDPGRI